MIQNICVICVICVICFCFRRVGTMHRCSKLSKIIENDESLHELLLMIVEKRTCTTAWEGRPEREDRRESRLLSPSPTLQDAFSNCSPRQCYRELCNGKEWFHEFHNVNLRLIRNHLRSKGKKNPVPRSDWMALFISICYKDAAVVDFCAASVTVKM